MKNISEGKAVKKKLTVYISGRKVKGEYIRWERPTGETKILPSGFYDVIAVREGEILLAVNLSEKGDRFQPSAKHQYWVTKKVLKRL